MLKQAVSAKCQQWNMEAEWNFIVHGQKGGKLVRQLWANGKVMVGPEGALSNRFIPLERAIEIYRAGWQLA